MVLSKVSETLIFVLDNSGVGIGSTLYKLYSQMVGIPMVTNCAPLVADLFVLS